MSVFEGCAAVSGRTVQEEIDSAMASQSVKKFITELSGDLITTPAGTIKRINKLLDPGLVTRESNPRDGRGAFIRMTGAGSDLILPVLRSVAEYEDSVISRLSGPERDELATLLRTLLPACGGRDATARATSGPLNVRTPKSSITATVL
ncbi:MULTISPECIES: hypothetical protein [unclassified Arthrobacter]|uniref:MarR family winged helix-turn-helix transcriptional regulator n=1 Tax=unclassified Arthrobacter TaxID=235627 RepID=UPI003399AA16